ncbi:ABC transporter permease [Geochorda subterranea]|uniref:ABC transporter permease n=1 Tax=Geochorda subterranea TaxID=3109564 RepID=A0ABZ1BNA0_9FIRM|nr:ABC transporter permease [Limnochorda sp. LNt]WRP14305.1 ABC transporter permease [Limnochorda sp. LNt]
MDLALRPDGHAHGQPAVGAELALRAGHGLLRAGSAEPDPVGPAAGPGHCVLDPGFASIVVAIAVVYVPIFARIARGPTLAARAQPFVEAARALGQRESVIVLRHVVPNILGPVPVQFSNSLATAILFESALSFLGLGVRPPTPSLGQMVSEARAYMEVSPWAAVLPGAAIMVVVLGFNLVSDALQQRFDPKLRHTRL